MLAQSSKEPHVHSDFRPRRAFDRGFRSICRPSPSHPVRSARRPALSGALGSAAALAVSMAVAILVYGMPASQTASGALEGVAIGFFPIIWIGINAIWLFKLTQESGHADVLRRALALVSADQRVQAVLIAFCFGAAGSAGRRRRTGRNRRSATLPATTIQR
jgi:hypothetical protein